MIPQPGEEPFKPAGESVNDIVMVIVTGFSVTSTLFGSKISDYYIQPHCGGDMALLKATAAHLLTEKNISTNFIDKYCNNVDEYKADLQKANIDELLEVAGVSRQDMETLAEHLANGNNIIFAWAMGLTHQLHGTDTIRTLANLSLLLGAIGKPYSGLLPLRGHRNV